MDNIIRRKLIKQIYISSAIILPIALFFGFLWKFAVNIPFADDYNTIVIFSIRWLDTKDWITKFSMLFESWNEYKIVFDHIVTAISLSLTGQFNIKALIFIGNLAIPAILLGLFSAFGVKKDKFFYFIPATFLLFQPMYSENMFWAMASLSNFWVMGFGILSLALLDHDSKFRIFYLFIAIFLAVLAYFTQKNGILFLILAPAILIYRKRYFEAVVFAFFSFAAAVFYYFYPVRSTSEGAFIMGFLNPSVLGNNILYFFTFLGNNFGTNFSAKFSSGADIAHLISKALPATAGILVTGYFIFLTFSGYWKENPFAYSLWLFFLGTAFFAAFSSRGTFGVDSALSSRYRVATIPIFILTYFSLVEKTKTADMKRIVFAIGLTFSILFWASSYGLKFRPVKEHYAKMTASLERLENDRQWSESFC